MRLRFTFGSQKEFSVGPKLGVLSIILSMVQASNLAKDRRRRTY